MTAGLIFAIGTLLTWIGWALAARFVVLGAQLLARAPGQDEMRVKRGLILSGVAAAALFTLGAAFPMPHTAVESTPHLRLPLVWFVMPYSAWLCVLALGFMLLRLAQGTLSINLAARSELLKSAGGWAIVACLFVGLYRLDPQNQINILRGGIELQPSTAAAILLLGVAGTFAMVLAGKSTATRGYSKSIVTQAALIAGSVVFGLPFAFLVITSFKEDIDMSSPNGIVWVPHVQDTVPFYDSRDPLYAGTYEGQSIEGSILQKFPDGHVRIDIQKPLAIRGATYEAPMSKVKEIQKDGPVVTGVLNNVPITGYVVQEMDDGHRRVHITSPATLAGREEAFAPATLTPVRHVGLKWQNYPDALSYLPPETKGGLVYLQNTLTIVVLSVVGTILSSAIVAYAFSRMSFPGKNALFTVLLSTMMLPAAVTLMPQFLIFRKLGWVDTLFPLWVPAFFASAFNVFLLRQFFMQIPMELEDAAKIDGCTYLKTFWNIMMPQVKPALAVVAVTTFVGAWNNFMGPLIYIDSPEHMPLSYALQLFSGERGGEPGLLMAFSTLCMLPVLAVFFFAQRYFIEGVTLSGLGGR